MNREDVEKRRVWVKMLDDRRQAIEEADWFCPDWNELGINPLRINEYERSNKIKDLQ
jgi:hypothetical protein